ncbi:MAG: hypothetical protein WC375_10620 [Methanomassiliicoccales archaeon]
MDDVDMLLSDDVGETNKKEIARSLSYLVFAAIVTGFFIWLLLGVWGYLQEMSYGHG